MLRQKARTSQRCETRMLNVWNSLSFNRKVVLLIAGVGVFAALMAMARIATSPSMTLLYSGLEPAAAGEVVRSLEQRGAAFDVRGGAIYVDSQRRDELRMLLASEGLPANSSGGYEILDNLSGFGTTSQMFDAAYWRAKEGELARTIVASSNVESARVHIANTSSSPFQRGIRPTASISLVTTGGGVSNEQATALQFLVASAVAGLSPADVTVIGSNGVIIGASSEQSLASSNEDRASLIKAKVERLLEARVGAGNAFVEVSIDTVTRQESVREKRFDPSTRVAISTDSEQRNSTASQSGSGQVTVASNLPDGDGGEGNGSNSSDNTTRERVNYEVSETETEIIKNPGDIKRLTVAVLINDQSSTDANGNVTTQPRSEEEMSSLRELVSSAVGFDETRGDQITLKSMSLSPIELNGTLVESSILNRIEIDILSLVQIAVLAIVALILGLFVIRPIFGNGQSATGQSLGATGLLESDQQQSIENTAPAQAGFGDASQLPEPNDIGGGDLQLPDLPMMGGFGANESSAEKLKSIMEGRETETVEILRGWLENEEEAA